MVNEIKSVRSPTLETIRMVEETIEENNGEYNKTQLWEKLHSHFGLS